MTRNWTVQDQEQAPADAVNPVDWAQARIGLAETVPRVTALLRSGLDPDVPALGQWSIAETAAHLAQAWAVIPQLALGEAASPLADIWDLSAMTTSLVGDEPERDLGVLADRIEASAGAFLGTLVHADPDETGPWLVAGARLPLRSFVCHLLNESLVHGYDMARAARRPWSIDPAHAALVLTGFIWPVLATLDPRAMVDQRAAAGLRATYDIRLRGGGQAFFAFDDGTLRVEAPSERRVDCHLSADPVALLLVLWARKNQWSAIATGGLLAWGRRPWLGLRLRRLLRNP